MSLFEDTNPRELKELLAQIETREMVLPDFQRDFVWDPGETQELIVSIAANYPAGSLLRIRNTQSLFACREFTGAPELNGHRATYLVLDGQQRLTSLYQAFYGVGEHRYFLNVGRLLEGADFDECLFYLKATRRAARRLESPEIQARELVMPLSELRSGAGGFAKWARMVARKAETDEKRCEIEDSLAPVEERWIQAIDDYRFPVVTLSDSTSAASVCTIFETLNRTGVKLSAYELLTARFWPLDVNLRQLWQEARDEHPLIEDFEVDPYYLMQVVSLLARSTPSCKRGDVLDLTADDVRKWWKPAVQGLGRALEVLRDDCGVIVPKWLPYATIVVPLAAILARVEKWTGADVGSKRQKIVRWYWCAIFGQRYERAPNSQAVKDVVEVAAWLGGGAEPETVAKMQFDPDLLAETTPKQRALYRGTICLILRRRPRDFHTREPLTGDLILEQHVDDHHIFPDNYLKEKVEKELRNCILNRTLIDRTTNILISDRAPSDYMEEIRSEHGGKSFATLLESHLLPGGEDSPLSNNDFGAFLSLRKDALWREIRDVTGFIEAPSLPAARQSERV